MLDSDGCLSEGHSPAPRKVGDFLRRCSLKHEELRREGCQGTVNVLQAGAAVVECRPATGRDVLAAVTQSPWGQLQTLEQSPVCSRNLKLPIRSLSIRNRRTCTSEVSSSSKIGAGGRGWPRGGLLALLARTLVIKVGRACSGAGI